MLSDRPKSGCKSLICPLHGGGSGNTLTATQQPRTPKQRAIFLNVERMTRTEKEELSTAISGCESRVTDLLLYALELSEILESPKEKPREDGGRPLKYINQVWEDVAELIAEVQKSAKYVADDVIHLITELGFYIENPTTSDEKALTPEEKGINPNVRPGTIEAVSRIAEALPGVKPHIRKDGVIEVML